MNVPDPSKVLFLDLDAVESLENLVQTVCEATKHPDNPILPLGRADEWDAMQARPWESRTVLFDEDEGVFKCWYAGADLSTERWWATGYAVSEDGLHWHKPRLGLIEYRGSKHNNMCLDGWGPIVQDDDEPDPAKRYKMLLKGPLTTEGWEKGVRPAYSPDGIHWTQGQGYPIPGSAMGKPDIVVLLKDDLDPDPARRYKMVWQDLVPATKPGPPKVRGKFMAWGPDLEHLEPSPANPILTPSGGLGQENHFLMLSRYAGRWVMLYECGWYVPNGLGNNGQYAADVRLAVSHDGEHFQRVNPAQKVIPRGDRGQWDDGFIVISEKPVIRDDTIFLYYCGQGEDWTGWPGSNMPEAYPWPSTGSVRLSRMGLATLRLDGFVCLETSDQETVGTVTTKPVSLPDSITGLTVNVGSVQVNRSFVTIAVLDAASDEPVSGFAHEDCRPVDRDSVHLPVGWKAGDLIALAGRRVKLQFRLVGAARLYAYAFAT
jgi:hypothetical protein